MTPWLPMFIMHGYERWRNWNCETDYYSEEFHVRNRGNWSSNNTSIFYYIDDTRMTQVKFFVVSTIVNFIFIRGSWCWALNGFLQSRSHIPAAFINVRKRPDKFIAILRCTNSWFPRRRSLRRSDKTSFIVLIKSVANVARKKKSRSRNRVYYSHLFVTISTTQSTILSLAK